jgi:hypothetical protein
LIYGLGSFWLILMISIDYGLRTGGANAWLLTRITVNVIDCQIGHI